MKKLVTLSAATLTAALASATVMQMQLTNGETSLQNVEDVKEVGFQSDANNKPQMVIKSTYGDSLFLPADAETVSFKDSSLNTINGHEYVDLGLSVLWATNNLGACCETSFGGKFAWAYTDSCTKYSYIEKEISYEPYETAPFEAAFYGNYINDYKFGEYGKGCVIDYYYTRYSFRDEIYTLIPDDDAAQVNWGGSWMTPSSQNWEELLGKCSVKYVENYNGKFAGYVVTSNVAGYEDKHIFLPVNANDYQSTYWANNIDKGGDNPRCLYMFSPKSQKFSTKFTTLTRDRAFLCNIRPVSKKVNRLKALGSDKMTYKVVYFSTDSTTILKVEEVEEGQAAKGYDDEIKSPKINEVFSHWSSDLTSVKSNLSVYPVFVPDTLHNYYTIKYYTDNGALFDSIVVLEGKDAPSNHWLKTGYAWKEVSLLKNVRQDAEIHADSVILSKGTLKGGHEYVDLGLSVNWATLNIEDTAYYNTSFPWADTVPSNYVERLKEYDKYNQTDGLTTIKPEDDAATHRWGKDWRIPTKAEFEELLNNCTVTNVSGYFLENGEAVRKPGYLFRSKVPGYEDKCIILPAEDGPYLECGDVENDMKYVNLMGEYWTASLSDNYQDAYMFFYGAIDLMRRNVGANIRPVTDK